MASSLENKNATLYELYPRIKARVCARQIRCGSEPARSHRIAWSGRNFVEHHAIAYRNPLTGSFGISLLYILATCGALLLSRYRIVRWYGALNVVGLTIVELVRAYAFCSVWCFYAAILSVIIYWQFRRGGIRPDDRLIPAM